MPGSRELPLCSEKVTLSSRTPQNWGGLRNIRYGLLLRREHQVSVPLIVGVSR